MLTFKERCERYEEGIPDGGKGAKEMGSCERQELVGNFKVLVPSLRCSREKNLRYSMKNGCHFLD